MNYTKLQLLLCSVLAIVVSAYGCSSTELGNMKYIAKEGSFNYTVHFCSQDDCIQKVVTQLHSAKESVKCAFYTVDGRVISNISPSAVAEIVVDKNAKAPAGDFGNITIHKVNSKGIMHNKYCIIDSAIVLTGSFNPTAAARNDYNNLITINSTTLASFYSSDFERLKLRNRKTPTTAAVAGKKDRQKAVMLNTTSVEVHFCPNDNCAGAVIKQLRKANSSIVFAAYSFTHAEIANELIIKKSEGVAVSGVIEKSTTGSKYSKHSAMAANGIDVKLESSKRLMHHKFFVIDNDTVITGSFNPTMNADERNDENLMIIRSAELAKAYLEEFDKIFGGINVQK